MLLIIVLYSYLFIMAKTTIQYIKTLPISFCVRVQGLTRARPGSEPPSLGQGGGRMTAPRPPENSKTKKDSDKQ